MAKSTHLLVHNSTRKSFVLLQDCRKVHVHPGNEYLWYLSLIITIYISHGKLQSNNFLVSLNSCSHQADCGLHNITRHSFSCIYFIAGMTGLILRFGEYLFFIFFILIKYTLHVRVGNPLMPHFFIIYI